MPRAECGALRDLVLQQDISYLKQEVERIKQARARYESAATALSASLGGDERLNKQLAAVRANEGAIREAQQAVIDLALGDAYAEAAAYIRETLRPRSMAQLEALNDLAQHLSERAGTLREKADETRTAARQQLLALGAVLSVISILLALLFTRSVVRPLREAVHSSGQIASGDLSRSIATADRDETGDVLRSIARMRDQLCEVIGDIRSGSHQIDQSIHALGSASNQMAARIEGQVGATRRASTAVEALAVSFGDVAALAAQVEDASRRASDEAASGQITVDHSVEAVARIQQCVDGSSRSIAALSGEIERINEVTQVIREIAEQTNLLALNAAIEAARAGEAGRGFAVVADEVRKLAERTSSSTGNISSLVASVQASSRDAVDAMAAVSTQVRNDSETSLVTRERLAGIVTAVDQTKQLAHNIAKAAREQRQAAEDVSREIEAITTLAGQNETSFAEVQRTADELGGLSRHLVSAADRFRIR